MPVLTDSPAWQALVAHHAEIKDAHLRILFADDPGRAERSSAEGAGLFLDYSKNRVTEPKLSHDASTNALIERYRRLRG